MRDTRRFLSMALASLFAWFGVAGTATVHAHPIDAPESVYLHMIADDAHTSHHHRHETHALGHDDAGGVTSSDRRSVGGEPAEAPDHEPVLHAHGCSHAATVSEGVTVSGIVSEEVAATWSPGDVNFHSLGHPPPRKPPRTLL